MPPKKRASLSNYNRKETERRTYKCQLQKQNRERLLLENENQPFARPRKQNITCVAKITDTCNFDENNAPFSDSHRCDKLSVVCEYCQAL